MKKVLLKILLTMTVLSAWGYDYGIKFVPENDRIEEIPENATFLNERYAEFTLATSEGINEKRIKDLETKNEVILTKSMYAYNFKIKGETPVLICDRDLSFYLKPDLTDYHLRNMLMYDRHTFYDGGAIVTLSGERYPVLIDVDGNIVRNDIVTSKGFFHEELVYCTFKDGSSGFIDSKGNLKISVPAMYKNSTDVVNYYFEDGLVVLNSNWKKYAVMDKEGKILFETDWHLENKFEDDMLGFKEVKEDGRVCFGYLDRNFKVAVPATNPTALGYRIPKYSEWLNERKKLKALLASQKKWWQFWK